MRESDKIDLEPYIREFKKEYPFTSEEEALLFIEELYRFLFELFF